MDLVISLVILISSAILHEVAHGFVADRLGDPTARLMGRLTLNPRSHIDPVMSLLVPLVMLMSGSPIIFGAAKPVPVDPFNLKEGRKDLALVSLAGPLTNILIAAIASLLLRGVLTLFLTASFAPFIIYILESIVFLNLLLAVFNLLPIPPLDGSKVFAMLLPEKDANAYLSLGNIGFFIVIFLMLFPVGGFSLGQLIYNLITFLQSLLLP